MFGTIKQYLMRCFGYESSPHKLAAACALAVYIAFCPFFGFHTLMAIGLGLLFRLNVPLMILIGNGINNPFTMIPIYLTGYFFGHWILHSWWGLPLGYANPWWMGSVNQFLQAHVGNSTISFWGFMLGGNLIGLVLGALSYLILEPVFIYLASQRSNKA